MLRPSIKVFNLKHNDVQDCYQRLSQQVTILLKYRQKLAAGLELPIMERQIFLLFVPYSPE